MFMKNFEIEDGVLIRYTGHDTVVRIPDSVTSIGDSAFSWCKALTNIEIPNSVTSIGDWAFGGCSSLEEINLNSVTSIGDRTFLGCKRLTSVTIPNSVTSIGYETFYGCIGLTSVTIGNGVTSIGDYAFYGCTGLTSVTIPNSVTSIGDRTFLGCTGLTSVTIPNSVTSIGRYAFYGCTGLTNVIIGNNIKYIEGNTFDVCKIKHKPKDNIAYKGLNVDMTCRGFQYEEGKTYTCNKAKLCECGFHACLNPLDCFNYYADKDTVYHEVILEDRTNEVGDDSKVCGKKITIGRRLTIHEMFSIFNELNKE